MRLRSLLIGICAAVSVGACSDSSTDAQKTAPVPIAQHGAQKAANPSSNMAAVPQGSGFDFYVLALSWSPAYCAREGRKADPRQCNVSKPYGFIVHGLWPQYERGAPDFCDAGNPSRSDIDSVLDLTPSPGLIRHEWEKHGSCSGLSAKDYFSVMRAARNKIQTPPQFNNPRQAVKLSAQQVKQAFIRANPDLTAQAIAGACPQNNFAEVRICMDKALNFRACPEVDRAGCKSQSVTIEPMK